MRRVFLTHLTPGTTPLTPEQRKHLIQVLRLGDGTVLQAFDAHGATATATLRTDPPSLDISLVSPPTDGAPRSGWDGVVASAVPKGERADWLVEKLAELGVRQWIPLDTARSVVLPRGEGKRLRWERIAQEAARQSHSRGVMSIGQLTPLPHLLATFAVGASPGWFGSTTPGAIPAAGLFVFPSPPYILIGPEGGWTPEEELAMSSAGLTAATFSSTVLRVETAAVVAASLATNLSLIAPSQPHPPHLPA